MAFSQIVKRSFSTNNTFNAAIKNVTVVGGGLMGSGIAQVAAQAGNNVNLVEVNADLLKNAENRIAESLVRVAKKIHKDDKNAAEKFVTETKNRIKGLTDVVKAVEDSDLVVEAIVENLEAKHKLFTTIDNVAPAKTIFASNTSSILIHEIAAPTKRKDRFGGLHFFNPVPIMKLVEVIKTDDTSEETHKSLMEWGKSIGKVCITCKDTPGFVVNRLLVPYQNEALKLYERGIATTQDIDTAMKLGAGYPMGPFELCDYVGLDTLLFILEGWHKKYPDNILFEPSETLKRLVKEGKLGRKTGEGFYKYNK